MTVEFLDNPQPRCGEDMIDYPFRVSRGQSSCTVVVGISGPAKLGKSLPSGELAEAASAWLRYLLDSGDRDPFSRPETDRMIDLTSEILDHWVGDRSFERLRRVIQIPRTGRLGPLRDDPQVDRLKVDTVVVRDGVAEMHLPEEAVFTPVEALKKTG